MAEWTSDLRSVGGATLALVFGVGLALFIGQILQGALPAGTGNTTIGNILTAVGNAVNLMVYPVFVILFVGVLYVIVKKSGVLDE
jgi:hypothetical protein